MSAGGGERHGEPVAVGPGVRRIIAPNPGPYTNRGTNSYLLGDRDPVLIDPGPDDDAHHAALVRAVRGRIAAIVLTHGHLDHAGLAPRLAGESGAPVLASPRLSTGVEGDRAAARPMPGVRPLHDGGRIDTPAGTLVVIETPGHAADHLAFALDGTDRLFCGDHVMAWSTSVVIPPDGSMADYMASLDRVAARPERHWLPGHGGPVEDGPARAAALKAHRLAREASILAAVAAGAHTLEAIVATVYAGLDPALAGAAALSAEAHLVWLAQKGAVVRDGGDWRPSWYGRERPSGTV